MLERDTSFDRLPRGRCPTLYLAKASAVCRGRLDKHQPSLWPSSPVGRLIALAVSVLSAAFTAHRALELAAGYYAL